MPRPALVDALCAPEFEAMLPRLVAYAARRLRRVGWGEGRDRLPSGAQAEELVSEAVEAALSGERVWPDDIDLETFLVGIMWSRVEHRYTKEKRRRRVARATVALEEPTRGAEDLHAQRELCAAIEAALASDPDTHALFGAMAAGATKAADRAERLGWSAERERAAHLKMNRRLAAAGLGLEPGDVGPLPIPGGRWTRPQDNDA